jgi:hypothetical protein
MSVLKPVITEAHSAAEASEVEFIREKHEIPRRLGTSVCAAQL